MFNPGGGGEWSKHEDKVRGDKDMRELFHELCNNPGIDIYFFSHHPKSKTLPERIHTRRYGNIFDDYVEGIIYMHSDTMVVFEENGSVKYASPEWRAEEQAL